MQEIFTTRTVFRVEQPKLTPLLIVHTMTILLPSSFRATVPIGQCKRHGIQ